MIASPVRVPVLERCTRKGRGQRIVFVYRMGVDTDLVEWPRCPPSRAFRGGDMNAFVSEVDAWPA